MKFQYIFPVLMFAFVQTGCSKEATTTADPSDTSVAVWTYCSTGNVQTGFLDYQLKIEVNPDGSTMKRSNFAFSSTDGSCTGEEVAGIQQEGTLTWQGDSADVSGAVKYDLLVTSSTVVSFDNTAGSGVGPNYTNYLAGVASPVEGQAYDITQNPPEGYLVAGATYYGILKFDLESSPNTLLIGDPNDPNDGSTDELRESAIKDSEVLVKQ